MWTSAGDKVVRSKSQEQDQCCQASQGSSLCPVVKWVCLLNHSGNSDQMRYRPDAITVALPLPVVRERSVPCLSEFYSVCVATSCSQVKQKFTITSKFLHFRVTFRINHQGNLKKKKRCFHLGVVKNSVHHFMSLAHIGTDLRGVLDFIAFSSTIIRLAK